MLLNLSSCREKKNEMKMAEVRWEGAFGIGDSCMRFYEEGLDIVQIAEILGTSLDNVERRLKLSQAFPIGNRYKNIPIDVYEACSLFPDPQKLLNLAWENNWSSAEVYDQFKKFHGGTLTLVPRGQKRMTPIDVTLGVDDQGMTTARKLYAFLELDMTHYSRWARKYIIENIFAEKDIDFTVLATDGENPFGGRPTTDYRITASFAKKLAMVSHSIRGEEARDYFIRVEQNAKALANGECTSSMAMTTKEAAEFILTSVEQYKNYLPKITVGRMLEKALQLSGVPE